MSDIEAPSLPTGESERVLVAIGDHPGAAALVTYGGRLAGCLNAAWTAAYVETPAAARLGEAERDRVAEALRLAARLGGGAVTVTASSIAGGIAEYAQANGYTHIVAGSDRRARWERLIGGGCTIDLIRRASGIAVHVMPVPQGEPASRMPSAPSAGGSLRPYLISTAYTAAALAASLALNRYFGVVHVGLVFLLAVLASAVQFGLWPSLAVCALAAATINFFFIPPVHTFAVSNPEDLVVLVTFGIVAIITSNLTARVRSQAMLARERAKVTDSLYQFSAKLAAVYALDDLLWATAYQIAQMLKVRVVILLPEKSRLIVRAGYPPEDRLETSEGPAADWAWTYAAPAGRGCDPAPNAKRLYLPMRTGRGTIGVIGLDSDKPGSLLTPDQRRLFDALSDQAALAIERVLLADAIEKGRVAAEADKLRGALLTSISHDLRTPLAVMLGAASSLKNIGADLDPEAHRELVATIEEEGQRLNRFIANLLDMTRLESGALVPNFDPTDIGDVAGSAAARAARVLAAHTLDLKIEPDLPLVKLDPVLFEQVLFNLLDNAGKYAPPASTIALTARRDAAHIRIDITDEGPGIAPADLERIFDKFYGVMAADKKRASTGLGLAIARGFVEAMGGTLTAGNRNDRSGAVFAISLPIEAP